MVLCGIPFLYNGCVRRRYDLRYHLKDITGAAGTIFERTADATEKVTVSHCAVSRTKHRCRPYGARLCVEALFPLYFTHPPIFMSIPKMS